VTTLVTTKNPKPAKMSNLLLVTWQRILRHTFYLKVKIELLCLIWSFTVRVINVRSLF